MNLGAISMSHQAYTYYSSNNTTKAVTYNQFLTFTEYLQFTMMGRKKKAWRYYNGKPNPVQSFHPLKCFHLELNYIKIIKMAY